MQVYRVKLERWECDIIKQCSQSYVASFMTNRNTFNPAPYQPARTQDEIDAKDDMLLARRKNRGK